MVPRIVRATVIATILIAVVVGILTFVDFTSLEEAKRCAPSLWRAQWPKYIGCAMAARGDLSAGLIGAAGALFAAWLAFAAVMAQIANERSLREQQRNEDVERILNQQESAKRAVKACILPAVRAAGVTLYFIKGAIGSPVGAEDRIKKAFNHVRAMLEVFGLKESVSELSTDDRIRCLEIIGTLSNLISVHENGQSSFEERCKALKGGLEKLHDLLGQYDPELANEFASVPG